MKTERHVIVGLSGGVDSATAACLLSQQGYRVTGVNIRVLDVADASPAVLTPATLRVSDRPAFDFPVFTLNLSLRFSEQVIRYFHDTYLSGATPNPCMVCNKTIKWFGLFEAARLLGADLVATGHYARTTLAEGRARLFKGADPRKDQSYFLWMLSGDELSKTLFPLGDLTKSEVRGLARSFGVLAAEKKESQEICFVPNDDYCNYLSQAIPGLAAKVDGGEIVDMAGKVVGRHHGYPFYTIGQRRGLGIATGQAAYVNEIDAASNRIRVGGKDDLACHALTAANLNWLGIDEPVEPVDAEARIRYRDRQSPCRITPGAPGTVTVTFPAPKYAVASGQAVVFYRNDEVLGGGMITGVIRNTQPYTTSCSNENRIA